MYIYIYIYICIYIHISLSAFRLESDDRDKQWTWKRRLASRTQLLRLGACLGPSLLKQKSEVDALGVITISRGCFERVCSNKETPPYHSNLSFVTLRNRRPTLLRAPAYCTNCGWRVNSNLTLPRGRASRVFRWCIAVEGSLEIFSIIYTSMDRIIHVIIYVYICIYLYIYIYACIYAYIFPMAHRRRGVTCNIFYDVYKHVYNHTCNHIYVYMCVCIYIYTCIHTCIYAYIFPVAHRCRGVTWAKNRTNMHLDASWEYPSPLYCLISLSYIDARVRECGPVSQGRGVVD